MTITATQPYHTLFAWNTPFKEVDGGGRAGATSGSLPQIGHLAIRDAAYTNGFTLCVTAKYGATMEQITGDLYVLEVMPKHPNSNTPYDLTTAFVAGDFIKVHKLMPQDVCWLACVSATYLEGQHLITAGATGDVTTMGVGGVPAYAHYWKVLTGGTTITWVKALYMGVAGVDTTA
jgi:hypothetical protein